MKTTQIHVRIVSRVSLLFSPFCISIPVSFFIDIDFLSKGSLYSADLILFWQITKSFWLQEGARKADIDTSRLLEQFAVKDVVTLGPAEPSNSQNIMLNQKIAHNFSEYREDILKDSLRSSFDLF